MQNQKYYSNLSFLLVAITVLHCGLHPEAALAERDGPFYLEKMRRDAIGKVVSLYDRPLVERPQGRGYEKRELHMHDKLYEGDRLMTSRTSRIYVEFYEKSELFVGSDTQVRLGRIRRGGGHSEETVLKLMYGMVRFLPRVIKPWTNFYLNALDRTGSLLEPGEYVASVDLKTGDFKVFVGQGRASLQHSFAEPIPMDSQTKPDVQRKFAIKAGEYLRMTNDGRIYPMESYSAELRQKHLDLTDPKAPNK
jgi:hypothetical protein